MGASGHYDRRVAIRDQPITDHAWARALASKHECRHRAGINLVCADDRIAAAGHLDTGAGSARNLVVEDLDRAVRKLDSLLQVHSVVGLNAKTFDAAGLDILAS